MGCDPRRWQRLSSLLATADAVLRVGGHQPVGGPPAVDLIVSPVSRPHVVAAATGPDLIRVQRFGLPPPGSSRCLLPVSDLATATSGNLQIH